MSQKRTIESFFAPARKKAKGTTSDEDVPDGVSSHKSYPFPIYNLPARISKEFQSLPARPGRDVNDQQDLDLVYFQPYMPADTARSLFEFLRSHLPFYRVIYQIKRGGVDVEVKTPRYTTVFGLDETSHFDDAGVVQDAKSLAPVTDAAYSAIAPRPIPRCLDELRQSTQAATGCKFNFCLVNFYASGEDSIAFHSDDERFLGPEPAIASFSLGSNRDFLMKHKPLAPGDGTKASNAKAQKFSLGSGDMILMRGKTQANWLHSIPKRTGKDGAGGRINITFRRAMVKGGTQNYYHYNVGTGPVYRWDGVVKDMVLWKPQP